MIDGKALSDAYRRAGEDFLADDLTKMFRIIKTPEQMAEHNMILRKVMSMIGDPEKDKMGKAKLFFRSLAHGLLYEEKKKNARKGFLKRIAGSIMSVSKG